MAEPEQQTVAYPLVDVLKEIRDGVSHVEVSLGGKADKTDVEAVRTDLRRLGDRTEVLESWRTRKDTTDAAIAKVADITKNEHDSRRNWKIGAAALLITGVGAFSSLVTVILR